MVKGTLTPPVPVLKAGHPVPTALLMNVSVGKCVGCGVLNQTFHFQKRTRVYITCKIGRA